MAPSAILGRIAKKGHRGNDMDWRKVPRFLWTLAVSIGAVACGGDDSDRCVGCGSAVPVRVIDGPIGSAQVCLDRNGDLRCGPGESTSITSPDGRAVIDAALSDVGQRPVVAVVGADAVDADHGANVVPFVLSAPAGLPSVISPLTSLVQAEIVAGGVDLATAESAVRRRMGLTASPLDDYLVEASVHPERSVASATARVAVLALQRQLSVLSIEPGTTDILGSTISPSDIDRAAYDMLLELAPALGAAGRSAARLTAAARESSLTEAARSIVEAQSTLTRTTAPAVIGASRRLSGTPTLGQPSSTGDGLLRALSFTDASNWFYRAYLWTAADAAPDANGRVRSYEQRTRSVDGVVQTWAAGNSPERAGDVHWNGSAWANCPTGTRNTADAPDPQGWRLADYCSGRFISRNRSSAIDIGGRRLTDVVETMRRFPGTDGGVAYAAWGPADPAVLGTATLPTGSSLVLQTIYNEPLAAFTYDASSSSRLRVANPDVAAGGDGRANPALACAQVLVTTPIDAYTTFASSLEQVISRNRGTPCVLDQFTNENGASLPANERWSEVTVPIGTVPNGVQRPAGTGNHYTTIAWIRVAFDPAGGNAITWYQCFLRTGNDAPRNCSAVGTGVYTIQTLGDARVMTFSDPPLLAARLDYEAALIERAGVVRNGFRGKGTTVTAPRLNLVAANAFLATLGLPLLVPE